MIYQLRIYTINRGAMDDFLHHFTKVFILRIDDDTMRRRLRERTNNDFGKQPEEVELMLGRNRSGERPAGAIDVDATKPLDQVVDEVLRLADCRTETSDSPPTPWSRRGPATGRSFVIPDSALPIGEPPDALRDVLRRETITRIEYSWSGDVLATLLQYLDEQGIDLIDADREGSVFVLTPDHRERYMARLDPSAFDGAVLERCYEELNGTAADGVGYAMLDGIAFLRDTLEALGPADVAVVVIG